MAKSNLVESVVPGSGSAELDINSLTEKSNPSNPDEFVLADSNDSFNNKKIKFSDLSAAIDTNVDIHGKTSKANPVDSDEFIIADSEDSFNDKKITLSDIKTSTGINSLTDNRVPKASGGKLVDSSTYINPTTDALSTEDLDLVPDAASQSTTFRMLNDAGSAQYTLSQTEDGTELVEVIGKTDKLQIFDGNTRTQTATSGEFNWEHEDTNAGQSISHASSGDLAYRIYGSGDPSVANYQRLAIGWNSTSGKYDFKTEADGTGIKREIEIAGTSVNQTPLNLTQISSVTSANLNGFVSLAERDRLVFTASNISDNIQIIDLKDVSNPTIIGIISNQFSTGIAPAFIQDPTDPTKTIVASVGTVPPRGLRVTIAGTTSYDGTYTVESPDSASGTFKISFPYAGADSGTYTAPDFSGGKDIAINGKYLYWLSASLESVYVFDVDSFSVGTTVEMVGAYYSPDLSNATYLKIDGERLYVTTDAGAAAIQILDISDPTDIQFLGKTDTSRFTGRIEVKDNIIFGSIRTADTLNIFNGNQLPLCPQIGVATDAVNLSSIADMKQRGSVLYVVDKSGDTISAWDLSNITAPTLLDSLSLGSSNDFNLIIANDYAYVLRDAGSLVIQVVNISDPSNLSLDYTFTDSSFENCMSFEFMDNYLLATCTNNTTGGELVVIRLDGLKSHSVDAGLLSAESAKIRQRLQIERTLNVGDNAQFAADIAVLGDIYNKGLKIVTPADAVFVGSMADFPAPSGGFIQLENKVYIVYNPHPEEGTNVLTYTDSLRLPDSGTCTIRSVDSNAVLFNYQGTGAAISSSSNYFANSFFRHLQFVAPNGSCFDFDGIKQPSVAFFSVVFFSNCAFLQFTKAGTVKNINFNANSVLLSGGTGGANSGLTFTDTTIVDANDLRIAGWGDIADTTFATFEGFITAIRVYNGEFEMQSNHTAFNFIPTLSDSLRTVVNSNEVTGDGDAFFVGESAAIDTLTDAGVTGSFTSITNNAGVAQFNGANTLVENQSVTIVADVDTSYDGTYFATNVSPSTFQVLDRNTGVILGFQGTDSGNFTEDGVLVSTTDTGTLSNGDAVNITGTTDYNGGTTVGNVIANTSFVINRPYVTNETPTLAKWDSGSLTPVNVRMKASGNVGIEDSKAVCGIFATVPSGDSPLETPISTADTFVDLTLSATTVGALAKELEGISRWHLISKTTGEVEYTGDEDFSGLVFVNVSLQAVSSTPTYQFALIKNDGVSDIDLLVRSRLAVASNSIGSTTFNVPITAKTGDRFRVQVANIGNTQNLSVYDYIMVAE